MDILELAKKENALYIQSCPAWNGKEVWQLLFDDPDGDSLKIGIPFLAVVDGSNAEPLSDEMAEEYMKYVSETRNEDEEFDPEIIKVA